MIPCPQATVVPAEQWLSAVAELRAQGFDMLDLVTAVDLGEQLQVVVRVRRSEDGSAAMVMTAVPADEPSLASLVPIHPGAAWDERETREMLGIEFIGLTDSRPLLLREVPPVTPLRRAEPLAARLDRPWPGAAEPEVAAQGRREGNPSRRRQRPLGVPDDAPNPAAPPGAGR